jgi:hypothetical protein
MRFRHGAVRPLRWPFGDFTLMGTPPPDGYHQSVHWRRVIMLIAVFGAALTIVILAVSAAVAFVAG